MGQVAARVDSFGSMTGPQRVAVLLMALGEEASTRVTDLLSDDEMETISLEIARLERVDPDVVAAVVDEWEQSERAAFSLASGGVDYARKLLERSFGASRAAQMLKRIESQLHDQLSLTHLRRADPQQLTALIRNEHPQLIALVLAYLDSTQTAAVLREMDPELGGDVVARMALMDKILPDVLQVIHHYLGMESDLAISSDGAKAGGPQAVADVLNLVGQVKEKELLDGVASFDVDLSVQIKNLMFVFEDIQRLDKTAVTRVLRDVETRELATALKVASEELKETIMSSMSGRARESLMEETEFLGPVRASDVQNAQATIVSTVRKLEEAGEIVLGGGDDEVIE